MEEQRGFCKHPYRNSRIMGGARLDGRAVGEPAIVAKDLGRFKPVGLTVQGDFFYDLQTQVMDVYTVTLDPIQGKVLGSPVNPARFHLGSNGSPDWSPDGRSLV